MYATPRIARWICLLLSCGVLAAAAPAWADETKVKGLFLYNLAKYVTWPAGAFDSDASPIVIGVVGDTSFVNSMSDLVDGHQVKGRDLKIISVDAGVVTRGVHVIYFPDNDYGRLREQARLFSSSPAIRVAEHKRFAKVGDIGFVMRDERVVFYVNEDNSKREGLRVSSKFMRLASGVE
jgi:hypothetical protein